MNQDLIVSLCEWRDEFRLHPIKLTLIRSITVIEESDKLRADVTTLLDNLQAAEIREGYSETYNETPSEIRQRAIADFSKLHNELMP